MNNPRHAASAEFYEAVIYVSAVIVTVLFHVLLLSLFSMYKPPEIQKASERQTISMLALNSSDPLRNKKLIDTLEYGDPTLIAKPNEKYGFSSVNAKKFSLKLLRDQSIPDNYSGSFEESFSKLGFYQNNEDNNLSVYRPGVYFGSVIPRAGNNVSAFKKEFPFCSDSYGKELKKIIQINDQFKEKIKLLNPKNNTVFLVIFSENDFIPRLKLTDSCGAFELDSLAMRSFMAYYDALNLKKFKSARQYSISIEWQENTIKDGNDNN